MSPITLLLWIISAIILLVILRDGAKEDVMTRYITSIDRFKWAFFAAAVLPFLWFASVMFENGYIAVFAMNLGMILLFWAMGKTGIIGGADAYAVMLCGIVFPFVFPAVFCFGFAAFAVRFCKNEQNAEDWDSRGVPYFVTLQWGYLLTVPLAVLFAASLFF